MVGSFHYIFSAKTWTNTGKCKNVPLSMQDKSVSQTAWVIQLTEATSVVGNIVLGSLKGLFHWMLIRQWQMPVEAWGFQEWVRRLSTALRHCRYKPNWNVIALDKQSIVTQSYVCPFLLHHRFRLPDTPYMASEIVHSSGCFCYWAFF